MVLDDRRDSQHQRKSVILWWGEMGAGTAREGERASENTISLYWPYQAMLTIQMRVGKTNMLKNSYNASRQVDSTTQTSMYSYSKYSLLCELCIYCKVPDPCLFLQQGITTLSSFIHAP